MLDPDRLLPGEDPDSDDLETAEHWLSVYTELLGFKQKVIGATESHSEELAAAAQTEAEADLTILDAERRRLARRFVFWSKRAAQLRET